ncbi:unnamed protein product [Chondrus crispus]|uniref:Uncharacterized protein n=1 Tax=Chondrus crispus TaxID=2769 RepID=R7QLR5_CHOCR|nr:unnamed protein product [Chondrus crispus]CDF38416.1 unnamed protein product [Chondrus crispus]|eukprot:XP_005718309.1 unnamed protein product [Chondrus crispus]
MPEEARTRTFMCCSVSMILSRAGADGLDKAVRSAGRRRDITFSSAASVDASANVFNADSTACSSGSLIANGKAGASRYAERPVSAMRHWHAKQGERKDRRKRKGTKQL